MRFSFILIFFLASFQAFAQYEPSEVRVLLGYGSEFRPDRNVEGNFKDQMLANHAFGLGYKNFILVFERGRFEESSGNSSMSVKRNFENNLLWLQWRAQKMRIFAPFLSAGAGTYHEKVETSVLNAATTNETGQKFLSGASVGLSLDVPVLWLSIEARVLFGDEIDPQPTIGGLARIGVWF